MSYIYSLALVEEYLAANYSDIDASALSNSSHMPKPSWWHDKTMEPSRHSQFGMTYAPLTERLGMALSTWFVGVSLAKTYLSPETGPDWTANGQGYGEKWRGLLARYNPDTHSLKTAQLSLLEDLTGCCATLPRWGLMLDGELYPQPMLEPFTGEKESGYWPTPCKTDGMIGWSETVTTNRETTGLRPSGCRIGFQLNYVRQTQPYLTSSGRYHPALSEAMMLWPLTWSDLQPLGTDRFQEWQQQHSPCFTDKG